MPSHQPNDASIISDNNDDQIFLPKKKRLDPRIVLSGIMMFILVSSSGLALVAQNRDTDNRSSASEGEYSNLPTSEPCGETSGNLIKNPSFEQNLRNWNKSGSGSTLSVTTRQPYHCNKSLAITGSQITRGSYINITQPISLLQNTSYRFSLGFKSEELYPYKEIELLFLTKASGQTNFQPVYSQVLPITTNNWGRPEFLINSFYSLPQDQLSNARILIRTKLIKGERISIDNLKLIPQISPSPTLSPTNYPFPTPTRSAWPTPTKMITGFPTPTPAYFPTPHSDPTPTRVPTNYPTPQP